MTLWIEQANQRSLEHNADLLTEVPLILMMMKPPNLSNHAPTRESHVHIAEFHIEALETQMMKELRILIEFDLTDNRSTCQAAVKVTANTRTEQALLSPNEIFDIAGCHSPEHTNSARVRIQI